MSDTWCTIESDPGVFTELIESIGVQGVQVEELYSLDDASFAQVQPVYGLVFLFKWTAEKDDRATVEASSQPGLFFARQVIHNACATQAILSVLLNRTDKIDVGKTLTNFKAFAEEFPPNMKGLAISNSETIRSVHNSFSRQEPFFSDGKDNEGKREDAFHFVAYLPHNGKVMELDGLKPGPIVLGDIPGASDGGSDDSWVRVASPAIEERIARYSAGEIRFNLMAIIKNRKQVAMEGKELSMRRVHAIDEELSAGATGGRAVEGDPSFVLAEGAEGLENQKARELHTAETFDFTIADEDMKFALWRKENARRKHNYVPFAVTLLKLLAEKGDLQGLMDAAAAKASKRQSARAGAMKKPKTSSR